MNGISLLSKAATLFSNGSKFRSTISHAFRLCAQNARWLYSKARVVNRCARSDSVMNNAEYAEYKSAAERNTDSKLRSITDIQISRN